MTSALALLLLASCAAFEDVIRFDDMPRHSKRPRPMEALKLQRHSSPQWLFFVSSRIIDTGSNSSLMEWELTSHMTVTPQHCNTDAGIVQMLDEALHRANPEISNITSSAFRLGTENCKGDACPCGDQPSRRVLMSHMLLEVKTRSPSPTLKPPLQYPLRVASFHTH